MIQVLKKTGIMLLLCIMCNILSGNILYACRLYNIDINIESLNFRKMDYAEDIDGIIREADKFDTSFGMDASIRSTVKNINDKKDYKKVLRYANNKNYEELTTAADILNSIKDSFTYFPVARSSERKDFVDFGDSFMDERTYGGDRKHEGTDIMPAQNISGLYPVISVSDGVILKVGWLTLGGYRLSIQSEQNGKLFYYYAHLQSYSKNFKVGEHVKAGQIIGYMGDTGYGCEGTTGEFPVHLHFGIYWINGEKEISINPYYFLNYAKNNILRYKY